jgi:hypothetical protein
VEAARDGIGRHEPLAPPRGTRPGACTGSARGARLDPALYKLHHALSRRRRDGKELRSSTRAERSQRRQGELRSFWRRSGSRSST